MLILNLVMLNLPTLSILHPKIEQHVQGNDGDETLPGSTSDDDDNATWDSDSDGEEDQTQRSMQAKGPRAAPAAQGGFEHLHDLQVAPLLDLIRLT